MEKLIYNFFNKTKGAISVFLAIVFIPMITISCFYVDASRMKLAKAVMESSADLALNTVLSNFDADLAEIYGLMASAQDMTDAKQKAEDFFKSSMVSQGLSEQEATEFSKLVSSIGLGESDAEDLDIMDLLGIETESVEISEVEQGSLINPAILKTQIVEFSKYRAPIDGITELFEKFSQMKKNADNSKKETKIIEEQENYYEAENEVLSNLEKAYNQLRKVSINDKNSEETLNSMRSSNASMADYHNKIVDGLYNFKGESSRFTYYSEDFFNLNKKDNHAEITETSKANYDKQVDLTKQRLEGKSGQSQSGYNKAKEKFESTANSITLTGDVNEVQYWLQMMDKLNQNYNGTSILNNYINYSNRTNKKSLFYAYDILCAKQDSCVEGSSPEGEQLVSSIQSLLDNKASEFGVYYSVAKNLYNISETKRYYITLDNSKTNMDELLGGYSADILGQYGLATDTEKKLTEAAEFVGAAEKALEKMETAHENWGNQFDDSDLMESSDLAKKNKEDVYDKVDEEVKKKVNEQTLTELKTRISNGLSYCEGLKSEIENKKYFDTPIADIKNVSTMAAACSDITTVKPLNNSQLQEYKNKLNEQTYQKYDLEKIKYKAGKTGNNPNLAFDSPELYTWIKEKIESKKENGHSEKDKDTLKDNKKKQGDKAKNNASDEESEDKVTSGKAKLSKYELNSNKNRPSKVFDASNVDDDKSKSSYSTDISSVSSSMSNLFSNFGSVVGNSVAGVRDQLYEMYYLTSNFTYDTYEYEMKYDMMNGRHNHVSLTQLPAKYGESSVMDKWNADFAHATPTNINIDLKHNKSYGNEIEYILYGGKNSTNKTKSYATIFGVRYAFNLIYAFTNFWNPASGETAAAIEALADAIAAATAGIVPAPLTKTIIILGLTAAESAYDISCLKMGMPVILFKNQNPSTWLCQFDSENMDFSDGSNGGNGNHKLKDTDIAFNYGDYLKLFLFIKIIASESSERTVLLRTADIIEANMRLQLDKKDFSLSKCQVYYQLSATCKCSYLMLPIPMIKNYTDSINFNVKDPNSVQITAYRGY